MGNIITKFAKEGEKTENRDLRTVLSVKKEQETDRKTDSSKEKEEMRDIQREKNIHRTEEAKTERTGRETVGGGRSGFSQTQV